MITIKRKMDIVSGAALKYKVWIDGEVATKLSFGEIQTLSLPRGKGEIQISNINGKSNVLEVEDGDSLEIRHSSLNFLIYLAIFMFGLALQLFNVPFFLGTLPIAIVFYIIIYKTVRLIRLEKASTTSRQ